MTVPFLSTLGYHARRVYGKKHSPSLANKERNHRV